MVAFNKFNQFSADLAHKVHNLGADALKVMLTNTAPIAANAVKADIAEITAGNGYAAGGFAVSLLSSTQTAGVYTLKLNDQPAIFTPSGGTVGPYRYAVLYNDTPTSPLDPLIGFWDFGSAITQNVGQPFNFDVTDAGGITLTII